MIYRPPDACRDYTCFSVGRSMNWLKQLFSRSPRYGEDDRREIWRWPSLESFFMDIRYGARELRKNRGFTIVAITSLALAIGEDTASFYFVDGPAIREL